MEIQNRVLQGLAPERVFYYFEELCQFPHGSGNVEQISNYCVEFAKEHGLYYRQDDFYNVIIKKPGTAGYENSKPVILQGHLDMVAVKEEQCGKNMETEGLDLDIKDGKVYAKQTSLGADDGIAIAYSLALLDSKDIVHPPLEAVFTVDEEVGMLGAAAIDLSDIKGNIMLNMDSEEEGIFLAGCAGGATVRCNLPVARMLATGIKAEVRFHGLAGGHSGTEINCQRANANVLMGRIMQSLSDNMPFSIISVSGGEKDNAIAKIGQMSLLIASENIEQFKEFMAEQTRILQKEYQTADPNLDITVNVETKEAEYNVYQPVSATRLILALVHLPYGVMRMSDDIAGLVQTSLNLGILCEKEDKVQLCYSVRSSVASEKDWLIERLESLVEFLGGECDIDGAYPAWEYKKESQLRDVMTEAYEELYKEKPQIQTIHAGVECGLIAEKISDLDCVSFGPDIFDIHTTREKLDIASVERTWNLILKVLEKLK